MRVGLFGGTFNPVHWGHLRAAEEIRELCDLAQIVFIPTHISPHKDTGALASATHRLKMLEVAIGGNPFFIVSEVELKRPGTSYSIETISHFTHTLGKSLTPFFILGIDAFLEIESWKNYQELFSLCNFIVMSRPSHEVHTLDTSIPNAVRKEFCYQPDEERFVNPAQMAIYFKKVTPLDISSHAIRACIHQGRSIKYLVPAPVEEYIREHSLYRP